jgi:hypothetical protein
MPERPEVVRRKMREFLYSKWFFGFLALVCLLDLLADLLALLDGWEALNYIAIPLDVIAVCLTSWMFIDLRRRHPKYGSNPPGGR